MINVGRKALITSGIVIALSAGGVITYLSTDNSTEKAATNNTSSTKSAAVAGHTKSEAFMKNAPIESIILAKFYYGDDANIGANNTSAALANKTKIDEQQFISASEKFISTELFNTATAYIGRSKEELEATNTANPEHIELIYNGKNVVEAVTLDITSTTPKNLLKFVGKPSYQLKDEAYLYHGQTYDFIIYTNEGKKFTKMTILPVLKQSDLEQEDNEEAIVDLGTTEEKTSNPGNSSKNKQNNGTASQKTSGKKNTSTSKSQNTSSGTSSSSPTPAVPGNSNQQPTPTPPTQDNDAPTTPTIPKDETPEPTPTPDPSDDTTPPGDTTPSEPPGGSGETPSVPAQ